MVAPSLWLLTSVLIMTFGHFGHKSCHRSCSQVTFYLPKSINSQCSSSKSNCLMEATITVDPTEDSFERVNITLTQLMAGDYLRDHTMYLTLTFPGHHRLPTTTSTNYNSIGTTNEINNNNNNNNPLSANGYPNNGNPLVSNGFPPYVRENNRFYNGDLSSSSSSSSSNSYLNGFSSNSNNNNNNRYLYPGSSSSTSGHHAHLETTTIISYSCRILASGNAIAEIIQGHGLKYSYVSNSSRSCSFIFNRYDYLWPTLTTHQKVDLINNGDFTVTLGYDDVTKDLRPESIPLHKMAFLRCCHRHHGGSKYLVIIEPSTTPVNPYLSSSSYYPSSTLSNGLRRRPSLDFYLQAYSPIPKTVVLELTGPSEQSLRVNVSNSYFNVSILTDGEWISVLNNLTLPKIPRRSDPFDDFRLNWTLPVLLETPRGSIVIEEGQYTLDIESDVSYSHREKVYITGKSNLINSPSIITSLLLPIIFCTIFNQHN
ncbi:uncharacterized protein LOC128391231 [Panonychus citri]|uniref:uncharacterized protein LOC128391231 n=1 Tax=Panonychus citri TaxID=50023 RepID=UPI002307482A|nr:uncharacterized protein LOC128391231 [Panonychus citri]XP_053207058.1 uncharacterized protein LOC128391231 [Panonychus citri]XP_053207059.1 uncharacterized protein LOC128391231 [Panonychus citri]